MVCKPKPCLLVQVTGLNFLIGAPWDTKSFLHDSNAMQLDAVLLPGLSLSRIGGLAGIRDATWKAGREQKLAVFGPAGTERMIGGLNAMVEAHDAEMTIRHAKMLPPFRSALASGMALAPDEGGAIIFDSGLVVISAWPVLAARAGAYLIYRFDTPGRTLIMAPCAARADDIARAVIDAAPARALVLELDAAGNSGEMTQADCTSAETIGDELSGLGFSSVLALPPPSAWSGDWQRGLSRLSAPDGLKWQAGLPGTIMQIPH